MARKIASRIWSIILSAVALVSSNVSAPGSTAKSEPTEMTQSLTVRNSEKPELFLEQAQADGLGANVFTGHRSHASHASHASHRSHYSGSGGSSTPQPSTPAPSDSSPSTPSESSPAVPDDKKSTTTPAGKTTDPAKTTAAPGECVIRKVFMRSGQVIQCDTAWITAVRLYYVKSGMNVGCLLDDVDVEKTLAEAKKACGQKKK